MKIRGTELHAIDRNRVLDQYMHRMTVESCERWPDVAAYMRSNGYRMPTRTDAEWLKNTFFEVRKDGRIDERFRHCETGH